ncbi:MAG: type II/IV secretion system protein, partial [Candidatus Saccharimonadales bacterium]
MALLTDDIQEKLITLLIEEGLVAESVLTAAEEEAKRLGKPLLVVLNEQGAVDDELLTHATAQ